MAKAKKRVVFICSQCGTEQVKWQGRCPDCGQWNTLVEETISPGKGGGGWSASTGAAPLSLDEVDVTLGERFSCHIRELDRVLGGGLVVGSLVLLGGTPGVGKSTLLLQAAAGVCKTERRVLYVTAEESPAQVRMRAERLGLSKPGLMLLAEVDLSRILEVMSSAAPQLVIIDSIQTVYHPEVGAAPGTVSQVRECAMRLLRAGKDNGITVLLVGHVTKEGAIAGPRILEHMVDTVLYVEGETYRQYRILRAVKNRFGSTNEVGVFEMTPQGMVEVRNPSHLFLAQRAGMAAGSVVVPVLEGSRPLLVEVQALTSRSFYGMPTRRAEGLDPNRVALLLAVLEKRGGVALAQQDVFVNVVGGVRVDEPAADLGVLGAVASCARDVPVDGATIVLGEVGLGGEVRAVTRLEPRLAEAAEMGFTRVVLPAYNLEGNYRPPAGMEVIGVRTLVEALKAMINV